MKRKLKLISITVAVLVLILFFGGLWFASNMLLFQSWRGATKDFAVCNAEMEKYCGKGCGNLRITHGYKFNEVKIKSVNGYDLPGWLIKTDENAMGPAKGVIMLIHGGGGDRRQETKYIHFYLGLKLDVLTLDLGCSGEAPCPMPGLSYGQRESEDVFSTYIYLTGKYEKVYAMGTSVGASAILIALPEMPKITAVIAENPIASFQRLLRETPASKSTPVWFLNLMIKVTEFRGRFDGLLSAENSLPLTKATPVFFIHSKRDNTVPYQQTQGLANLYNGPKTLWFPDKGDHAAIWDVDHADYEKRVADFINSAQ